MEHQPGFGGRPPCHLCGPAFVHHLDVPQAPEPKVGGQHVNSSSALVTFLPRNANTLLLSGVSLVVIFCFLLVCVELRWGCITLIRLIDWKQATLLRLSRIKYKHIPAKK